MKKWKENKRTDDDETRQTMHNFKQRFTLSFILGKLKAFRQFMTALQNTNFFWLLTIKAWSNGVVAITILE